VAFLILFGALSVQKVSTTADETYHLRYGANILDLRAKRFDDSKMPITALNAIPGALSDHLPSGSVQDFLSGLFAARLVTILFSAGVAYLVYRWSGVLYGAFAGLASLLLYVLDPNLIAHSQLVTTDVYAAGCVLAVSYSAWKFAGRPTVFHGLVCAAALGLSQLAKYSTIVLLPLMITRRMGNAIIRRLRG
jgi:Gpi18-like mannosyltransferase